MAAASGAKKMGQKVKGQGHVYILVCVVPEHVSALEALHNALYKLTYAFRCAAGVGMQVDMTAYVSTSCV